MPRPFEPVGDVARWRTLYELLAAANVDEVVTYADMADALDLDPVKDRRTIQGAITRAAAELLEINKHAIEPIRNAGYRIVKPAEHLVLAQRRSKKAERSLVRSSQVVTHVDYNGLASDVRRNFEAVGRVLAFQIGVMRRLDIRQRDLEESLVEVQSGVQQTQRDVQSHDERIAWLEEQERRRTGGDTRSA